MAIRVQWYGKRPGTGVGVATGRSALVVVDIDPRHGGSEAWAQIVTLACDGVEPLTWKSVTGSGGHHLFFREPANYRVRSLADVFRPVLGIGVAGRSGIDIRAQGGGIVAPPSVHASGKQYEWCAGQAPGECALADLPAALLDLLVSEGAAAPGELPRTNVGHIQRHASTRFDDPPRALAGPFVLPERIPDGRRNQTLFKYACSLRAKGEDDEDAIFTAVQQANETRCARDDHDQLLSDEELSSIVISAMKYEQHDDAIVLRDHKIVRLPGGALTFRFPPAPDSGEYEDQPGETSGAIGAAPTRIPTEFGSGEAGRFTLHTAESIRSRPPPHWLVQDLFLEDSTAFLSAIEGSYKSFFLLELAACVAGGWPFFGRPVKQGPVLYLLAEGTNGLGLRLRAWEQDRGTATPSALRFVDRPAMLQKDTDLADLLASMRADEFEPALVILDTFSRVTVGADENSTADASLINDNLDRLKRSLNGATIIMAHHLSKAGEMRGNTAYPGAADTLLKAVKHGTRVTISCDKQKDGADKFHPFILEARPVNWDEPELGVPHGSVVLDLVERPALPEGQAVITSDTWGALLILERHFGGAGATSTNWKNKCATEKGIAHTRFNAARRECEDNGWIVRKGTGTKSIPWVLTPEGQVQIRLVSG